MTSTPTNRADQPAFPQLAGMSGSGAACGMTMRELVALTLYSRCAPLGHVNDDWRKKAWQEAEDFLAADPRKGSVMRLSPEDRLAEDKLAMKLGLTPIPEETVADVRSRLAITEEPCTHAAHDYDGEHEPLHESCPDCGGVGSVQVQIPATPDSIHTDGAAIAAAFGDGAFASEEEDAALVEVGRQIYDEWLREIVGCITVGAVWEFSGATVPYITRDDGGAWPLRDDDGRITDEHRALLRRVRRERDAQGGSVAR